MIHMAFRIPESFLLGLGIPVTLKESNLEPSAESQVQACDPGMQ